MKLNNIKSQKVIVNKAIMNGKRKMKEKTKPKKFLKKNQQEINKLNGDIIKIESRKSK